MAVLGRNIWSVFKAIMGIGFILLVLVLYLKWQTIYERYENFHLNRVEMSAQALSTILTSQELMLEVLGQELIKNYAITHTTESSTGFSNAPRHEEMLVMLNGVLKINPGLAGLGLVLPNGQAVISSSRISNLGTINLAENPLTQFTFQLALGSNSMVVGRTYFSPIAGEWVIPLRKAIKNQDGVTVAVMTAGIKLEQGGLFREITSDSENDSYLVYREQDRFIQFWAKEDKYIDEYTKSPISEEQSLRDQQELSSKLRRTIDSIKSSQEVFSVNTNRQGENYITAFTFNPRYQLWTISEVSYRPLITGIFISLLVYLLIYAGIMSILYRWFDVIENAEKKRLADYFYLSRHDDLTGLLNKTGLLDAIIPLIEKNQPFTVGVLNIDNFRKINDQYGLDVADKCLKSYAEKLSSLAVAQNSLFRLSGDEFILLTSHKSANESDGLMSVMSSGLEQNVSVNNCSVQLTATVGFVEFPIHGKSIDELIRKAHMAIYKARDKRQRYSVFEHAMEKPFRRRLVIEEKLREAMQSNQGIYIHYQLLHCAQYKPCGVEALSRWKDSELGIISPEEFISVAEKSGLMVKLGKQVMELSIKGFTESILDLETPLTLSINISVIQFKDSGFVEETMAILKKYNLAPEFLILEITESLFMDDFEEVISAINMLRKNGIKISMDDFGTGYSSLSLLRKLPIDELKIDKSFLDELLVEQKAESMVQSIISFAHSCNLVSVAEGVEYEQQAIKLKAMGCDKFQGYYFAKPADTIAVRKSIK